MKKQRKSKAGRTRKATRGPTHPARRQSAIAAPSTAPRPRAKISASGPASPRAPGSGDERLAFSLLLMPFVLMAVAIAASHTTKPVHALSSPPVFDIVSSSPIPEHRISETRMSLSVGMVPRLNASHAEIVQPSAVSASPAPDTPTTVALLEVGHPTSPSPASLPLAAAVGKFQRLPLLEASTEYENAEPVPVCASAPPDDSVAPRPSPLTSAPAADFGMRLATAARAQTADVVIYDERYRRIPYPLGDVPPLYGVCTDVIIRAYRALGIDLQALVQQAGLGTGDSSIDHRRTEVLRRFFALYGERLPVTHLADDYRPGDIVTYHRPQNAGARSHIALVSDRPGPSGKLMIVHNRGWGPQLEDALFVDRITGHYRFAGSARKTSEARLYNARSIHRSSRTVVPAPLTP